MRRLQRCRIVIVSGAAGIGKSAAIARRLAMLGGTSVLYAVRSEHNTCGAFARAIAEELQPEVPRLAGLLSSAFRSVRRQPHPWDDIALWMGEQLVRPVTIAVDELHRLADDAPAFEFLSRLMDRSAPHVPWILGTRPITPLPIPRWLAGGLVEVVDMLPGTPSTSPPEPDARQPHETWRSFAPRADILGALVALPALDHVTLAAFPAAEALLDDIAETVPEAFTGTRNGANRRLTESARSNAIAALQSIEPAALQRGRIMAARALEAAHAFAPALQLATAANAYDDVLRILIAHGIDLFEHDFADVVDAAIHALPDNRRRDSAVALMLEGIDEASRSRYDLSDSWFEHALHKAPDDRQRLLVEISFTIELLRRFRPDALGRLEELAGKVQDERNGAVVNASLASGFASNYRLEEARGAIAVALAALNFVDDRAVHAVVHQRAAFVALKDEDTASAERHADVAAILAHETGDEELRAVARSVSYVVASSYRDEPDRALTALAEIERAGVRLHNAAFRRFSLLGRYFIAADRCDARELAILDDALNAEELQANVTHVEDILLPARALVDTWTSSYRAAYATLAGTAERQRTVNLRALRWAELALYSALAENREEAWRSFTASRADMTLLSEHRSADSIRTMVLLSLTAIVLGETRLVPSLAEPLMPLLDVWPRWRPFWSLLSAIAGSGTREPESLLGLLDEVRAAGLGGWACLIENIPVRILAHHRSA